MLVWKYETILGSLRYFELCYCNVAGESPKRTCRKSYTYPSGSREIFLLVWEKINTCKAREVNVRQLPFWISRIIWTYSSRNNRSKGFGTKSKSLTYRCFAWKRHWSKSLGSQVCCIFYYSSVGFYCLPLVPIKSKSSSRGVLTLKTRTRGQKNGKEFIP